ncbi:uncharacterized protein [Setaria viridis]|uniref:uncharacterized protein n=1 Tax=Setaria viridis TaxID=4556 RepID=UPI003B3AD492
MLNYTEREYFVTTNFSLNAYSSTFTLTNFYAPTAHEDKYVFLSDVEDIARSVTDPWILIGDFNMTCEPGDKNNDSFNIGEVQMFNDMINSLALIEIPLVDRAYTWSNKHDNPTLVRLDWCFVNVQWDSTFPNTSLTSLTRFAYDHVPLLLSVSTKMLKSSCFWFENAWLQHPAFKEMLNTTIGTAVSGTSSKAFVKRLKNCRHACRSWCKRLHPHEQREADTKILINALDLLEEESFSLYY